MQTSERIISYPHGVNAGKVCKTEHNPNWPYISDHPYRILIIGDSGSGKTNVLLNLTSHHPNIDKIYLYAKDPYEAKFTGDF